VETTRVPSQLKRTIATWPACPRYARCAAHSAKTGYAKSFTKPPSSAVTAYRPLGETSSALTSVPSDAAGHTPITGKPNVPVRVAKRRSRWLERFCAPDKDDVLFSFSFCESRFGTSQCRIS